MDKLGAGAASGLVEVAISYPMDVFKVRLQDYAARPTTTSVWSTITNKPSLLYRGAAARFLGIIPVRMFYWGGQSITTDYLNSHYSMYPQWLRYIGGGIVGGMAQSIVDNPVEVIKTRRMMGLPVSMKIIQQEGFIGSRYTIPRNILFAIPTSIGLGLADSERPIYNFGLVAAGGVAGSIISQPLDYYKTQTQLGFPAPSTIPKFSVLMSGGAVRAMMSLVNMGVGGVAFIWFIKAFNSNY